MLFLLYFVFFFDNSDSFPISDVEILQNSPSCSQNVLQPRNGKISSSSRWKNFRFFVDPTFSPSEFKVINDAISTLKQILPCLQFSRIIKKQFGSGDYVHVTKNGVGCSSPVGRIGGRQVLLLGPRCVFRRMILHEFFHALGLSHEHTRPDRDDYVTVLWNNIRQGSQHNFYKKSPWEFSSFGVPYNQNSIMHYGPKDFSGNGEATLISKNGKFIGPISDELQETDINKLRIMYNCTPPIFT